MRYTVKNWNEYQHYKDRNPPWIKLHFSILSSDDWVLLDDKSRLLAVVVMLVASRHGGEIDGSERGLRYLRQVAYLKQTPNLTPLIDCGFLVPQAGASDSEQMKAEFRPEERREETETEERQKHKDRFDQFWKAYPKKRKKGDAEKAFKAISPDGGLLSGMLEAIAQQRRSFDWRKDDGKFIPYPATWLRAKCWEDRPDVEVDQRIPQGNARSMAVMEKILDEQD